MRGRPQTGYGLPRSNGAQPFEIGTFEISDSSRFLAFSVGVAAGDLVSGLIPITPGTDYLQLTIDLPDGLQAAAFQTDNALVFLAPDATPLPAALPLFATGLGALSLLGWRRKRKQAA